MSVVAFKGRMLAADSRAYTGSTYGGGWKKKLRRITVRLETINIMAVVGITLGDHGADAVLLQTLAQQGLGPYAADINARALLLMADGELWHFHEGRAWTQLHVPFFAIGSGGPFAMGAMAAAYSAKGAVDLVVSNKMDLWTDGPVQWMDIDGCEYFAEGAYPPELSIMRPVVRDRLVRRNGTAHIVRDARGMHPPYPDTARYDPIKGNADFVQQQAAELARLLGNETSGIADEIEDTKGRREVRVSDFHTSGAISAKPWLDLDGGQFAGVLATATVSELAQIGEELHREVTAPSVETPMPEPCPVHEAHDANPSYSHDSGSGFDSGSSDGGGGGD